MADDIMKLSVAIATAMTSPYISVIILMAEKKHSKCPSILVRIDSVKTKLTSERSISSEAKRYQNIESA